MIRVSVYIYFVNKYYYQDMEDKIYKKILKGLKKSLLGYEVNGNPTKRLFALRNIARKIYCDQMEKKRVDNK